LQQEPVGNKHAAIVAVTDDDLSLSRISEDSEKASTPSSPSTPVVETSTTKMTFDSDFGTIHKRKSIMNSFIILTCLVHEEPEFKQQPLKEFVNENKSPVEVSPAPTYYSNGKHLFFY
jgi:hypothetical protein